MNNGTLYCYRWINTTGNAVTTGTTGVDKTGTVLTRDTGVATIDSTQYATAVITNDQIVVSATVPATFTFTLGANTDSLGTLSTGAVGASSGVTATVITNAQNGWITWAKDLNQGLVSAVASKTITTTGTINATPDTLSAGTEGYVLDVNETADPQTNGSIDAEYNGGADAGGTYSANYQPINSGTGPTSGYASSLVERAAISGTTPAATDYTDTLTVVAAGQF
jgi:hypothetical protein